MRLGHFAIRQDCFCTVMASCCSRATWCTPLRGANHITARDTNTPCTFAASGSCDCSGCAERIRYTSRCPTRLQHAGPAGYCSGWRHCRTTCIRHDTWDPGRAALLRLTATTCSPWYSLPALGTVPARLNTTRQRGALRLLGRGPKKLETQKHGPWVAHWLRMQMPCRGN